MKNQNRKRISLKNQQTVIKAMDKNVHPRGHRFAGQPYYYNLSKSVDNGGLGLSRITLRRYWLKREKILEIKYKVKRFRINSENSKAFFKKWKSS